MYQHTAVGALHNSDERCDAPKCHEDTRVAVQEEILSWINHGDVDAVPKRIKWLTGPAGTGKTAVMGTIAEICQAREDLAAAFFFASFSASTDRKSKKRFVPTLAYQLLQNRSLRRLRDRILASVKRDAAIFDKRLSDQFEELILRPLREMPPMESPCPKVILIDGLDECEAIQYHDLMAIERRQQPRSKEQDQTEILEVLLRAAEDPYFPFRIIIASRPEHVIRQFFSGPRASALSTEIFLDQKYNPDADIELFLRSRFADIRRRYSLSEPWPTDWMISALVSNASGQFIYAATVLRFVETPINPPHVQLEQILALRTDSSSNPFAVLDALYNAVLSTSPNPSLAAVWIVQQDKIRDSFKMANAARWLMESFTGETEFLFSNLASLVAVSGPASPADTPYLLRLYHKSLFDFLVDPARSRKLHVSVEDETRFTTECYLKILKSAF